jgi:hypothetical protein
MQKLHEWRNAIATAACDEIRQFFQGDTPAQVREHVVWALDPQNLNYRYENGAVCAVSLFICCVANDPRRLDRSPLNT